jgi:hypothetical protein
MADQAPAQRPAERQDAQHRTAAKLPPKAAAVAYSKPS